MFLIANVMVLSAARIGDEASTTIPKVVSVETLGMDDLRSLAQENRAREVEGDGSKNEHSRQYERGFHKPLPGRSRAGFSFSTSDLGTSIDQPIAAC
jgi:hypothetical protein